ncbi:N-acetylneuraminate synthase family protein [Elusimicrobiota bacterium]
MDKFASKKCFIVAEIGINHNGKFDTAIKMIGAAKECGADAVKLQTFTGDDFYWKDKEFIFGKSGQWKEQIRHLFDSRKLTRDEIRRLYEYSNEIGILCFSTPLSFEWLDFLEGVGNPIYKISSGDVTCLPLIEEIAKIGKPIILSTGKSKLSDVDAAAQTIQQYNSRKLGILHCVAAYPAPLDQANLKMIQSYAALYDCVPGFSDHTEGILAASVSVAFGAKIIEKHFTLDKNDYGPDHWFSMDQAELRHLVSSIREVERMVGHGHKQLLKIEEDSYIWGSRCIVLNKNKKKGETIKNMDLDYKRPCLGLRSDSSEILVGGTLVRDMQKDMPVALSDLELSRIQ